MLRERRKHNILKVIEKMIIKAGTNRINTKEEHKNENRKKKSLDYV